jgi:hypothetical protein
MRKGFTWSDKLRESNFGNDLEVFSCPLPYW